ncbi:response regulator (plasmid) [Azospirillum baldaniorum]|uniref:Response regulator receiver domain n=1 Tax=Azospirillum baldaniorum TaxID=1064539 RepID=A0A9P1JVQ5_9PROT|nr:response regulator [Azospirillum baldaniorum]AWJ92188.1 response regulator [Azospirillum baldaniorum]TWA58611.1 response regulator receiver domain-containing protein [Azospirillum baldaniorum]TWA73548.1 response regulator receiver domain-containing protein [Azospirillum brasilense]CCD00676.1 response regulator receiver domain [Azospirillum baldaniorum]
MARILVIDDVPAFTALLRMTLETQGHQVAEANDGLSGLSMLERESFDLAIVDMMMPGLDGIELIRRLRARGASHAPSVIAPAVIAPAVIAMSGGTDEFPAAFSLNLSAMHGADRVLYKPFDNSELITAVDELLAARAV